MTDTRCCGTGTCLIDAQGRCWCGQQWDGDQMCRPASENHDTCDATSSEKESAPTTNTE
jgi:hypothetical protein